MKLVLLARLEPSLEQEPTPAEREMDDVMKSVEDRLPVEQVELSTGRAVAVHHRRSPTGKLRLFFVHGSCASMLQYAELIEHFSAAGYVSPS
jgi:hypothetical protein